MLLLPITKDPAKLRLVRLPSIRLLFDLSHSNLSKNANMIDITVTNIIKFYRVTFATITV